MKIAVLAFGSLVNNLTSDNYGQTRLEVHAPYERDALTNTFRVNRDSPFRAAPGLKLPIRLGRVSREHTDKRCITMVLHEGASDEQVFYAKSKFTHLNEAIKNLREREGISNPEHIGYINLHPAGGQRTKINAVANKISLWAYEQGFDAVIWTDLPLKGVNFAQGSTGREILPLLQRDAVLHANTKDYIHKLPKQPNQLQRTILAL